MMTSRNQDIFNSLNLEIFIQNECKSKVSNKVTSKKSRLCEKRLIFC
jgi:hypothetical protein